jgi:hypothetical protein
VIIVVGGLIGALFIAQVCLLFGGGHLAFRIPQLDQLIHISKAPAHRHWTNL